MILKSAYIALTFSIHIPVLIRWERFNIPRPPTKLTEVVGKDDHGSADDASQEVDKSQTERGGEVTGQWLLVSHFRDNIKNGLDS